MHCSLNMHSLNTIEYNYICKASFKISIFRNTSTLIVKNDKEIHNYSGHKPPTSHKMTV